MDRGAGTYRGDRTGVICVRVGDTENTGRTEDNLIGEERKKPEMSRGLSVTFRVLF